MRIGIQQLLNCGPGRDPGAADAQLSGLFRHHTLQRRALGPLTLIAVADCTVASPPVVPPSPMAPLVTASVGAEERMTPHELGTARSDYEPPDLATRLDEALAATPGTFGLVVELVPTGEGVRRNQTREFRWASVYKLLLALVVLRQVEAERLSLEQIIGITESDATEPEPAGGLASGKTTSVRGALDAVVLKLPDEAAVYTKIGEPPDASNLAGWIETRQGLVVISFLSEGADPESARLVIGEVATAADAHFNR